MIVNAANLNIVYQDERANPVVVNDPEQQVQNLFNRLVNHNPNGGPGRQNLANVFERIMQQMNIVINDPAGNAGNKAEQASDMLDRWKRTYILKDVKSCKSCAVCLDDFIVGEDIIELH